MHFICRKELQTFWETRSQQLLSLDNTEHSGSKTSKHLLTVFSFLFLILWDRLNFFEKVVVHTFQIRKVLEGNIPPHVWISSQETSSYTRNGLQWIHLQVPCSATVSSDTWLGTVICPPPVPPPPTPIESEFPADKLEKIVFAEDAIFVLLCLGNIYSGANGH